MATVKRHPVHPNGGGITEPLQGGPHLRENCKTGLINDPLTNFTDTIVAQ